MKSSFRFAVFCVIAVTLISTVSAQSNRSLEGMWQGALDVRGMKLRIVFILSSIPGGYRASMDSPDQGAKGIPTDSVIVRSDSLWIVLRALGAQYAGRLMPGDSQMAGRWSQSGATFLLDLKRSSAAITYRRPQMPVRPFPYTEEEVVVRNTAAGIELGGTLSLPSGQGPFPAVVLITGSGAQDRDETIFEHKPFLVLADHLTRNGIAVLRMDDRGVGKSGGVMTGATSMDFAGDISAAVDVLQGRPEVQKDRIGLIGHSEGGVIGPIVAVKRSDIRFVVMLAGPSISGAEILIQQDSLISLANGAPPEDVRERLSERRELFELLRRTPDAEAGQKAAEEFLYQKAQARNTAGRPDSILRRESQQLARRFGGAWMRFFLFYDPMETLRKVRCPILALNGEKDLQVPVEANLRGIEQASKEGGNGDVTVKKMTGLNHLFQKANTGSPMEYATIEETFNPDALRLITEWIAARVR